MHSVCFLFLVIYIFVLWKVTYCHTSIQSVSLFSVFFLSLSLSLNETYHTLLVTMGGIHSQCAVLGGNILLMSVLLCASLVWHAEEHEKTRITSGNKRKRHWLSHVGMIVCVRMWWWYWFMLISDFWIACHRSETWNQHWVMNLWVNRTRTCSLPQI